MVQRLKQTGQVWGATITEITRSLGAAKVGSTVEQRRFLTEVRKAVGQLQKFVQPHPVIDPLDGNPIRPVAITCVIGTVEGGPTA